ncbi:MAG: hypothetical protein Q8O55_09475 [Dehalococcoidales bacterium]|nr:hypothetical protein [Dehalococcoidales bacterium]
MNDVHEQTERELHKIREQDAPKQRLYFREKQRKQNESIRNVMAAIEENFHEDELQSAKVFFADALTASGYFSSYKAIAGGDIEQIARNYGLDFFDAIFILDKLSEISSS